MGDCHTLRYKVRLYVSEWWTVTNSDTRLDSILSNGGLSHTQIQGYTLCYLMVDCHTLRYKVRLYVIEWWTITHSDTRLDSMLSNGRLSLTRIQG